MFLNDVCMEQQLNNRFLISSLKNDQKSKGTPPQKTHLKLNLKRRGFPTQQYVCVTLVCEAERNESHL